MLPGSGKGAEDYERIFQQPDSIVDPQIIKHLKAYIKSGGKPATAVELLVAATEAMLR